MWKRAWSDRYAITVKDEIITGHPSCKYHEPVCSLFLRTGNKVAKVSCYCVWLHALTQDSRQTVTVQKFWWLEVATPARTTVSCFQGTHRLLAVIPNYSLAKIFHVFYFCRFEWMTKNFWRWINPELWYAVIFNHRQLLSSYHFTLYNCVTQNCIYTIMSTHTL